MFLENYSFEIIISAVLTLGVILLIVRIYLNAINKPSDIQKPDWLDSKFSDKIVDKRFRKGQK